MWSGFQGGMEGSKSIGENALIYRQLYIFIIIKNYKYHKDKIIIYFSCPDQSFYIGIKDYTYPYFQLYSFQTSVYQYKSDSWNVQI